MNHDCDPSGCGGTARHRPPTTFADVLVAIESVSEQLKVLVSAVDDLRCEVEWQGRDADRETVPTSPLPVDDRAGESLRSAAGRLSAYEKCLWAAPRGLWLDKWTSDLD